MIRNETEYQEVLKRLSQDDDVMNKQRESLKELGLTTEEIEKAMEPMISFNVQLVEEAAWYEKVKRGNIEAITNLTQIGRLLIALRIASGLSQKELAKKLEVSEAQVSRDERNEYHNVSCDRAQKIVGILGARLTAKVEIGVRDMIAA